MSPHFPSQSYLDLSHAIDHDAKSLWLFDKWRTIEVDHRSWITGDNQFHLSRFILLSLVLLTQNRFNVDAAIDARSRSISCILEEWWSHDLSNNNNMEISEVSRWAFSSTVEMTKPIRTHRCLNNVALNEITVFFYYATSVIKKTHISGHLNWTTPRQTSLFPCCNFFFY